MKRLTIRGHLNVFSGYGNHVIQHFNHFTKRGIFCAIRPTKVDEPFGRISSVPVEARAHIVSHRQPEDWELMVLPPDNQPTPGKKTVFFSMYESTEMPAEFIRNLNKAEVVVVPCQWNKECFQANGVTRPIHVVPLGIEAEAFRPSPVLDHGPIVFGVAGRTLHCAKRKAVQEAIDLFLTTFAADENVRLHVKIHADDSIKEVTDPRVVVSRTYFEPYQIDHWLRGITVFLSLVRSEGMGMWQMQSLACGRPVIAPLYGGLREFMTPENSFIIPHREVDVVSGESNTPYLGQWSEPNQKEAAKIMRSIAADRNLAIEKGAIGPATVREFTWEKSTDNLIKVLEEAGVWS